MPLNEIIIAVKGAGEMASAVAWRLYMSNFRNILMLETDYPLAVRREVSFCEAVHEGEKEVEQVRALRVQQPDEIKPCWQKNAIAVAVDPQWQTLRAIQPEVIVDAVLAKKNLGTHLNHAPMVIGLGPGFYAGKDVHLVIETNRGHNLGKIITSGEAEPNTGIPGSVKGFTVERVYWAEHGGVFSTTFDIGDEISEGDRLGDVDGTPVIAKISGVLRGILRNGTPVRRRTKLGDIDPRASKSYCGEVSDKALSIGGGVLEAVCAHVFSKD